MSAGKAGGGELGGNTRTYSDDAEEEDEAEEEEEEAASDASEPPRMRSMRTPMVVCAVLPYRSSSSVSRGVAPER